MIRFPLKSLVITGLTIGMLSQAGCASGLHAPTRAVSERWVSNRYQPLIAVAEPLAAQAGMDVLKRGGTAADAAVAIQAMLGLIEPQSSGLGGGSFMLYYEADTGKLTNYNGREVAPAGATPDMFLGANGKPLPFGQAVVSGRATGVPGAMFMLDRLQKEHGKLAWSGLFDAAIKEADTGFVITPRLGNYLQNGEFPQKHTPDATAYFSDDHGAFKKAGDRIVNRDYATTLRAFAAQRSEVFRKGPIAEAIVAKTHEAPLPGTLTVADLAAYQVKASTISAIQATTAAGYPLCLPYRVYIICTTDTPSGGVAVIQGLMIASQLPFDQWGPNDPRSWQGLIEVERLMYADRDQYEGDTKTFAAIQPAYLDPAYTKARAAMITIGKAQPAPLPGQLAGAKGKDQTLEPGGTSHFVIRDTYGNVLSMTTTVESIFGTGRMVGGFFLNNQLTDFSFSPLQGNGQPVANSVAPGKHPRSSMAPLIVFDQAGKTVISAVGSPGGSSIPSYNLKTLIAILDWHMPMQDAINLPNVVARGTSIRIEPTLSQPLRDALTGMGYTISPLTGEESGINGFLRAPDGSYGGGSDLRREGVFITGISK